MEENKTNNDEGAAKVKEPESQSNVVTEQAPEPAVVSTEAQEPIATTVTQEPKPTEEVAPKPKSPRPKWFLPAILAGLLALGGGAAAYVTVFQKSADSAWKSALKTPLMD